MTTTSLILGALLASVPGRPDAVVMTASPTITRPIKTSSRTHSLWENNIALTGFFTERMEEAWGIVPTDVAPADAGEQTFYVHLDWTTPTRVVVLVADANVTLTERPLDARDMENVKIMGWLLVRSTIERALIRPLEIKAQAPVETAAIEPEPVEEELLYAPPADTASVAEPVPEEETPEVEAAPPIEEASTPTVPPTRVRPKNNFVEMFKKKVNLKGKSLSASIVMLGYFDTDIGGGFNPAVQGRLRFSRWLTLGGELTALGQELGPGIDIFHIPVTLFAGFEPAGRWLELGMAGTADFRFVSAVQSGDGFDLGVYVGPYARARLGLFSMLGADVGLVGEVGTMFGVKRSSYLNQNSQRVTDGPAVLRMTTGLEIRWD